MVAGLGEDRDPLREERERLAAVPQVRLAAGHRELPVRLAEGPVQAGQRRELVTVDLLIGGRSVID